VHCGDLGRLVAQQASRPEGVGQVVAAVLQRVGQAAVEDDRLHRAGFH
jgi:hypothetical protein